MNDSLVWLLLSLLGGTIGLILIGSYFANIYKIIRAMSTQTYSVNLVLRFVGVFFLPIGIIMGILINSKY